MKKISVLVPVMILFQTLCVSLSAKGIIRSELQQEPKELVIEGLYYELKDDIAELTWINRDRELPASIVIPASIKYDGKVYQVSIGRAAFSGNRDIKSVVISEGITDIPEFAFNACPNLENMTIPKSVKSIGRYALVVGSNFKTETIDGVIYLGDVLIEARDHFTSYHAIREGTRIIAYGAFESCIDLRFIDIPDGVTYIGSNAFASCRKLTDVTLPESVISIGDKAFYMCSALESIDIPTGVTSIEESTFSFCLNLKSVTIPSSVTYIASNAFMGCTKLKKINTSDESFKKQIKSGLSVSDNKKGRGVYRGHEYVDMGLSVKWATHNVGASKPEMAGNFYAWGEIKSQFKARNKRRIDHDDMRGLFGAENYRFFVRWDEVSEYPGREARFAKYNEDDHKRILDPEDDVASVKWGGKWRMPTVEEFIELQDNCTWTWSCINGVYGQKITSNVPGYEGRYIFIPAPEADWRDVRRGSYWSSQQYLWGPGSAACQEIYDRSTCGIYYDASRCNGCMVRPVCP